MPSIWDPWHPLPLLYHNINIYSLHTKNICRIDSRVGMMWIFVTFPRGNFNSGFAMTITYWCYNKYIVRVLHILFSTFRSCTHDWLCLFVCILFSRVLNVCSCMWQHHKCTYLSWCFHPYGGGCCTVYIQGRSPLVVQSIQGKSPHMCLVRPLHEPQGVFAFLLHVALRKLQYLLIPFTRK